MAQYTSYATYVMFFQSQIEFDFAVAVCGGKALIASPATARALFGLNYFNGTFDTVQTSPRGIYSISYSLTDPGDEINNPLPSGTHLSVNVDSVVVAAQPGVPASIFPGTNDMLLKWIGIIIKTPKITSSALTLIRGRRFGGGLELAPVGEGGAAPGAQTVGCRDASRTNDGIGFAIRGGNTPGIFMWDRSVTEYVTPADQHISRERFYFRLRTAGSTSCGFWRCKNSVSPAAGAALKINGSGGIEIYKITAASVQSLLATISPNILFNTWYRIDILLTYSNGITDGSLIIWINGVMKFNQTFPFGTDGMGTNGNHASSNLGRWEAAADNTIEYDLDDWVNCDSPLSLNINPNGDPLFNYDLDFNYGSSFKKQNALAAGGTANWTGNFHSLNQGHNPDEQLNSTVTSTTALAEFEAITDVENRQDTFSALLGMIYGVLGIYSTVAGSTDGKLGASIDGNPYSAVTIDQSAAAAYNSIQFNAPGAASGLPYPLDLLSIKHTKSNDANLDTTRMMQAVVEYLGVYGAEDYPALADINIINTNGLDVPRVGQLHNCRYPNTIWGYVAPIPNSPVYAVGGTYVGNGTGQVIVLPAPCHFLWIRALTGGATGVKWFGASLGGHRGTTDRVVPNYINRIYIDNTTKQTKFTIAGTDAEINAVGVTYQYIAFCDPGMRFNLCGAYNRPTSIGSANLALQDSGFTPVAGFIQNEILGSASNAQGLGYKGPGHSGSTGNLLNGTAQANWGTFAAGILAIQSNNLFANANQANYSLWRTTDGCANIMVQMFSYTGNGAGGNRTINCTPASGRFPLFILVIPHNGVAVFRDPSHTGANSAQVTDLTNVVTGITGTPAIDQIQVGVTLNANLIVYDVFIIPGSTVGMLNGTYYPAMCAPPSSPWPVPPNTPPTGINVLGNGGIMLDGTEPLTLLKDISGIYTLTPGLRHDELYDRQTGQTTVNVKIPDPTAKTGYLGG